MRIPIVRGLIDRRILVNFRIDPEILSRLLPSPFRPQLVHGCGVAGICLIRLKHIRPRWLPPVLGLWSENAAHRIAVEWKQNGELQQGVYIPRRDTSSRLNVLLGGRLFPGIHRRAEFRVDEQDAYYRVNVESDDRRTHIAVAGHLTSRWPSNSVFGSLQEASDFFECGSLGYSAAGTSGDFDGLELRTLSWSVQPLEIERIESSFFENPSVFPHASVTFDCALLMQQIEHEWHGRQSIRTQKLLAARDAELQPG